MISGVNSTGNAPGNQPGINTLWMKRQVIILMFRRNDTECQLNKYILLFQLILAVLKK